MNFNGSFKVPRCLSSLLANAFRTSKHESLQNQRYQSFNKQHITTRTCMTRESFWNWATVSSRAISRFAESRMRAEALAIRMRDLSVSLSKINRSRANKELTHFIGSAPGICPYPAMVSKKNATQFRAIFIDSGGIEPSAGTAKRPKTAREIDWIS